MNTSDRRASIRRAMSEFLLLPTCVIVGFLLLAVGMYFLERRELSWAPSLRHALEAHIFADAQATADLLSTIAASLITVTSITISLLLLALQQTAASLTSAVFDQFLRRRLNQLYFGFFVGLALFSLVTLATVNEPFNPVLTASLALLLTVVALFLLIVLLYTTVTQMRPAEIVGAIHNHTLAARERQLGLIRRMRSAPAMAGDGDGAAVPVRLAARAVRHGYVTQIDLDALSSHAGRSLAGGEVILRVAFGSFVSTGDVLADVSAASHADAERIVEAVCLAIRLERTRDIAVDPADGIEEIETIAWTSVSTSKSNPAPGLLGIRALRDLLARWARDSRAGAPAESTSPLPVVYTDIVPLRLIDALETLAVVSTESMQHQSFTEVLRAFTVLFDRLPPEWQSRVEDAILRILSGLGDHVLTGQLEVALADMARVLAAAGRGESAAAVDAARARMRRTVGVLHSRSTRASLPPAAE